MVHTHTHTKQNCEIGAPIVRAREWSVRERLRMSAFSAGGGGRGSTAALAQLMCGARVRRLR